MLHWKEVGVLAPHIRDNVVLPIRRPHREPEPQRRSAFYARPSAIYPTCVFKRLSAFVDQHILYNLLVLETVPAGFRFRQDEVEHFVQDHLEVPYSLHFDDLDKIRLSEEFESVMIAAQQQAWYYFVMSLPPPRQFLWSCLLDEVCQHLSHHGVAFETILDILRARVWFPERSIEETKSSSDAFVPSIIFDALADSPLLREILQDDLSSLPVLYGCHRSTLTILGWTREIEDTPTAKQPAYFRRLEKLLHRAANLDGWAKLYRHLLEAGTKPSFIFVPQGTFGRNYSGFVRLKSCFRDVRPEVAHLGELSPPDVYAKDYHLDFAPFLKPFTDYASLLAQIDYKSPPGRRPLDEKRVAAFVACFEEMDKQVAQNKDHLNALTPDRLLDSNGAMFTPWEYLKPGSSVESPEALLFRCSDAQLLKLFCFPAKSPGATLCPVHFVHPLLNRFPRLLDQFVVPEIERVVQWGATDVVWNFGLKKCNPGPFTTALPVYIHPRLTRLYRTLFLVIMETTEAFQSHLTKNIARAKELAEKLDVYVSLVSSDHVHVQYNLYQWAAIQKQTAYIDLVETKEGQVQTAKLVLPGRFGRLDAPLEMLDTGVALTLAPWLDTAAAPASFGGYESRFPNLKILASEKPYVATKKASFQYCRDQAIQRFVALPPPETQQLVQSTPTQLTSHFECEPLDLKTLGWAFSSLPLPFPNSSLQSRHDSTIH